MSGSYALPFLEQHSAELAAWVAVAPVGLSAFKAPADGAAQVCGQHAWAGGQAWLGCRELAWLRRRRCPPASCSPLLHTVTPPGHCTASH